MPAESFFVHYHSLLSQNILTPERSERLRALAVQWLQRVTVFGLRQGLLCVYSVQVFRLAHQLLTFIRDKTYSQHDLDRALMRAGKTLPLIRYCLKKVVTDQ